MAGRRPFHNDREPRSIVLDVADEMDLLEYGPRVAKLLCRSHRQDRMFHILRTVQSRVACWTDGPIDPEEIEVFA